MTGAYSRTVSAPGSGSQRFQFFSYPRGVEADNTRAQNAETPLERICALPEHVADRELTTNQERARFIARDVCDYAEKAPLASSLIAEQSSGC
ncbi:hypothetical protein [Halalkalicoccus salilacus]|uniref:hypothetical protein n=1 Tax=Halalkalicoccus salilacus TaxID=3117459 RepID=UPI00300F3D73